jgi:hypothetical protein
MAHRFQRRPAEGGAKQHRTGSPGAVHRPERTKRPGRHGRERSLDERTATTTLRSYIKNNIDDPLQKTFLLDGSPTDEFGECRLISGILASATG